MKFVAWLAIGLLLGPSALRLSQPHWISLAVVAAGGFFMFCAGWELKFLGVRNDARFLSLAFAGSFFVPLVFGYFAFDRNIFLAVAISISALPVAIQILKEKNLYATEFGRRAITVACLCDVGAWLVFGLIFPSENLQSWILNHWVVAAFFAGLLFGRFVSWRPSGQIAQAWVFAPLLFIGLGWKIDLIGSFSAMTTFKILIVAISTKGLGTYLAVRAMKIENRMSIEFAAILNARGAMEILAAGLAFEAGLIDATVLSALVVLGVATSVMAVPIIRKVHHA